MKAMQETEERDEQIHQVTKQNTKLMALVQDQQKKIEELMKQSKELMNATTKGNEEPKQSGGAPRRNKDSEKGWCSDCKEMGTHSSQNCYSLEANRDKRPQWYISRMDNKGKQPGKPGER